MPEAPTTPKRETRAQCAELRLIDAADDDGMPTIEGYAAVFNSLSEDLGGFREIIKPGAFRESIKNDDIRALVDHETGLSTIGRTSAGTLKVSEDKHGLKYSIKPPDTQAGRDIVALIRRGDISESSFSFEVVTDKWETIDGKDRRTLIKVNVYDVAPVTFAAYPETDVAVRARKAHHAANARKGPTGSDLGRRLDLDRADD